MKQLPDVVYVVKEAEENEELRYSLRSLVNVPHGRLFIAGFKPEWLKNCVHIPMEQKGSKFTNSTANLLTACKNEELSDDFIFMNDDFFVMKPIDSIPAMHRGKVADVLKSYKDERGSDEYVDGMEQTKDVLNQMGFVEPLSYELHLPIVINKKKFIQAIAKQRKLNPHMTVVHKRTLYGNFAGIAGDQTDDVKIYQTEPGFDEDMQFLSTTDESFRDGFVGALIRDRFEQKCQYEEGYIEPTEPSAGRPTIYTRELGDEICARISEGRSLRSVCNDDDMPDKSTVFRWLRLDTISTFRDQYARAKREAADAMGEDLLDIAEDALKAVEKHAGEPKLSGAIVQAHKLKADNLKWTMSRQNPKKYGERINVASDDDEPVNPYEGLDDEMLRKLAKGKQ